MKSANLSESIKSERLQNAQAHLQQARVQRQDYNDQCKKAYDDLAACSKIGKPPTYMHYSFDFAQQLQYPFNSQQPGEIYFLSPRKCGLFGVCCEAQAYQINY